MRDTWRYLCLLVWLKSRLIWRTYTRNTSGAVGAAILVLFFVPFSLLIAGGLWAGFAYLGAPDRGHLLRLAFLGVYAWWLFSPIFGYALTEDFDLEKLLLYPISPRQVLAGVIAGSALDFGLLLLVPVLVVVIINFTPGLAALPVVLLLLGVFLFHTVALSQTMTLAAAGLLRSRRSREAFMVAVMLFFITVWALPQLAARNMTELDFRAVVQGPAWRALAYSPPGLAASALSALSRGDFAAAGLLLVPLVLLAAATLYAAGWLVHLAYSGEGPSPRVRPRRAPAPARPPAEALPPWLRGRLPPVVEAMMRKEFELITREPYLRMILLQCGSMLLVGLIITHSGPFGGSQVGLWIAPLFVTMMQSAVLFNLFGAEGSAAVTLFLLPGSRRHLLLGKNLAFFTVFAVVDLLAAAVLAAVFGQPGMAWLLTLGLWFLLAAQLSLGNLVSIWFPYRIVMRGWRVKPASASQGMTYGFIYMFAQGAALALSLPALAALLLPTYVLHPLWFALTLPCAAAYLAGLYVLSLRLAEKSLLAREMEMAEQLSQPD